MFPSWSWLEWRGDLIFPYWARSWLEDESRDGVYAKDVGVANHIYTRKSEAEATTTARVSMVDGHDKKILLKIQGRRFGIVRCVPDPPGYGDTDISDHFLTRQDGSAIRSTQTYELPFHSDVIPLLLGDRSEVLHGPAELAYLVRSTGIEKASDFDGKWDRVLAMLIKRIEDGTADRLTMVNLSGRDWLAAPVSSGRAEIILV